MKSKLSLRMALLCGIFGRMVFGEFEYFTRSDAAGITMMTIVCVQNDEVRLVDLRYK